MKQSLQLDQIDVVEEERQSLFVELAPYLRKLQDLRTSPSNEPELSLALPDVEEAVPRNVAFAAKYRDVELVFLVGIGGSNLGALAVHQAVFGTQANLCRTPKLVPVDTVDGLLLAQAIQLLVGALQAKQRVLLIVASKSGSTTETVANAELLIEALVSTGGSIQDSVVVISDMGSALYDLSEKNQIPAIRSPKWVGGRYSVFSDVGLFPLAVLGVQIEEFMRGGRVALDAGLSSKYVENIAAQHAIAMVCSFRAGKPIHDLFCFSPSLELYGKWFRQLTGESVGKSATVGIVPTVSIGSTDLHSVVQLYLAGPDTTFTTFVRVKEPTLVTVPATSVLASLVSNVEGQSSQSISDAILDGTRHAYAQAGRTFCTATLARLDARSIGELMQQNMLTMMFVAHLLGVNAFDQPAVELYKTETRRLLQL